MGEIADIKDRDSLRDWLSDQPREVAGWIAARAAARVVPLWWGTVLTEDSARERDLTALPVLRSLLISTVGARVPSDDIMAAGATAAPAAARSAAANDSVPYSDAATDAVHTVAYTAIRAAGDAAHSAATAATAGRADLWTAIRADADQASSGTIPDAVPLWRDGSGPLADDWARIKAQVVDAPDAADWRFWLDWYDAQLEGRTMLPDPARTCEMLEEIALIDPATWDAGPEVVNPKIREIWELHRLRAEVAALQAEKKALLAARASQAQRSHNQPPEGLVDDQPELARQITIVWDSLDEARDELEQDAPDKSRLREIAERLLSALRGIARYCGKVADTAVMSAAKVGGGAVGTAVLDHVVNNGRLMQFAKDLLTYGAG